MKATNVILSCITWLGATKEVMESAALKPIGQIITNWLEVFAHALQTPDQFGMFLGFKIAMLKVQSTPGDSSHLMASRR